MPPFYQILTAILGCRDWHSHFTEEETEAQRQPMTLSKPRNLKLTGLGLVPHIADLTETVLYHSQFSLGFAT